MALGTKWDDAEWQVRVDLAAAYRLVALFGWDDLVFTHISAKVPDTEHFLVNPYGSMFEEVTASSLVKVSLDGSVVGFNKQDINPAGFTIHSCIHQARPEVACVMHTHSINGVAVSMQVGGLLPISQFALTVTGSLGYHDYEGFALREEERPRLARDLGDASHLMLRNHGLLTVGASVADAFLRMHRFEAACMAQLRAQSGGAQLVEIPEDIQRLAASQVGAVRGDAGVQRVWPGLLRRVSRQLPGFDQ